jgi:cation/acetate symporter
VLFPMFFLGLWWENTNRQGALAGMSVGLTLWVAAVVNDLIFHFSDLFAEFVPAIGAALVGTPLVFVVTIAVSMATDEPPERIKKMVRQCHSPEPMGQQQSAEDVVMSADGGQSPADD